MLAAGIGAAQAEVNVVVSIKPVHALVAAIMDGAGTPDLIIEGTGSPHNYALKPSQAQLLQNADLVFWIGHDFEQFLEKPIEGIATNATSVALMDSHGLTKIKLREGGDFENHDHDDDDHDDHDNYAVTTMTITQIMTTMMIMTTMTITIMTTMTITQIMTTMTTMMITAILICISGWTRLMPRQWFIPLKTR
jgi:ABC-type Zn uptake system ZnuABC Zn-binding protein ZnuA